MQLLSEMDNDGWPDWGSEGIYLLKFASSWMRGSRCGGRVVETQVVWTEKKPGLGLSLSSGGKSIVYAQDEFAESDLMLVRNVR